MIGFNDLSFQISFHGTGNYNDDPDYLTVAVYADTTGKFKLLLILLFYLIIGAFVGIISGLLGVGGGLIIVPAMLVYFQANDFSLPHQMQLAVGTSLATIIITGVASAQAHHRAHVVNWSLVYRLTPAVMVGAVLGAWLADLLPSDLMQKIFALFVLIVALRMLLPTKPTAQGGQQIETGESLWLPGSLIGLISALVGIGGGSLTVPYLLYRAQSMLVAVGTSSACGVPIALAGTIGFMVLGWNEPGLPAHTLGYVYYPALFGIVTSSVLFAPIGARAASRMPTAYLKRIFAIFLFLVGIRMLFAFN